MSGINHIPNTFYLELREDYIRLCLTLTYRKSEKSKSSPYCKALILAIMEKWTNEKASKHRDLHISMTYGQWIEEMYGLFARNAIIDSLEELVVEGLISREAYKSARGGRDQYRYLLNHEEVNSKLKATFTNQPCEEEQHLQVNDQGGKVNVATLKNKPCSSSPTLKSKRFIESDTQNHYIESDVSTSPSTFTSTQQTLLDWFKPLLRAKIPKRDIAKLKQDLDDLAVDILSQEDMVSLHQFALEHTKNENPYIYPANLTHWQGAWRAQKDSQADDAWYTSSVPLKEQLERVRAESRHKKGVIA